MRMKRLVKILRSGLACLGQSEAVGQGKKLELDSAQVKILMDISAVTDEQMWLKALSRSGTVRGAKTLTFCSRTDGAPRSNPRLNHRSIAEE